MDLITIALSVLLVIIAFCVIKYDPKQSRVRDLLKKIPGPPASPIFGNAWELITSPMHRYDEIYRRRNKQYSPIYRTWMGPSGEVNINTAELAEVILSSSEHINKSKEYTTLAPWLGDCLFLRQGTGWRTLRKIFSTGFSTTILDNYIDVFKKNSEIFLKKIEDKIDKGVFNICPFIARYTLDIICETTIGIKVDAQNEHNMSYVSALHDGISIITERHTTPWLHWDFTFNRSSIGNRFKECVSVIHNFVTKVIEDRKSKDMGIAISEKDLYDSEVGRKHQDLISIIGGKMSEAEIRESVDGMVFAGHDTTYVALSWALQLLGEHTDVQEKAYEELEGIFEGSDREPMKNDLQEMKYLERVIKETLRLYPSAPAFARQTTRDIQIGEYTIPAGISIWIQAYFIQRDPKYYENPEEFNPDNFLPEKVRNRHPYSYLPFSAGPRSCMGQKYAIAEMKTLLSYILRNFKIKSLRKTKDLSPVHGLTLSVHEGVYVSLAARDKSRFKN